MYNNKGTSSAASAPETEGAAAAAEETDPTNPPPPASTARPIVSLIDYEYSGYNPRGFDVGNHFCEWTADYATPQPHELDLERYPSPEERRSFCGAYLGAMNGVGRACAHPECEKDAEKGTVALRFSFCGVASCVGREWWWPTRATDQSVVD